MPCYGSFSGPGRLGRTNTVTLKYQYRLAGELQDRADTAFLVDLPNTIQIIAPVPMMNP
jgi:hypothetical protein